MKRARILIADDHKMFSQGLAGLLEEEFDLVGIVENGEALIEETKRLNPDLILVDISMPVLNGLDAVGRLIQRDATAKVVFLTMHTDARLLNAAFRCGGMGYVLKQSAGEELLFALRQVLAGHKYVSPVLESEGQPESVPVDSTERQHFSLTPRQREVLQLLSEGCTMKEIASRLNISARTAESHKYEMMEALKVGSTAELIQYAIKLGLIST